LTFTLINYENPTVNGKPMPNWAQGMGWGMSLLPLAVLVLCGCKRLIAASGKHDGRSIWSQVTKPRPGWRPASAAQVAVSKTPSPITKMTSFVGMDDPAVIPTMGVIGLSQGEVVFVPRATSTLVAPAVRAPSSVSFRPGDEEAENASNTIRIPRPEVDYDFPPPPPELLRSDSNP
jgi:hypothetical protein